jgi:S1-C subfamily serine protease
VNWFDVLALALICVGLVLGVRSGAVPQAFGLMGLVGGLVLVMILAPLARALLAEVEQPMRALLAIAGVLLVVGICEGAGSGVGRRLQDRYVGGFGSLVDGVLGGIVGVAQAVIVIWIVGGLVAAAPVPSVAQQALRSEAVRTISGFLPPPATITGQVARIVGASGLPELFVGLEPTPAEPVDLPGDQVARVIAAAATGSVVRVESTACGRILTGTGFAVAPGYVVTNAHVVAGASDIAVLADAGSGRPRSAAAVLFEPRLDIALLRVPGLRTPGLTFAARALERGEPAAALGHPSGAGLRVIPAAVSATYRASGRDLYGETQVDRGIVEIRGDIGPGDSGGPLVLADGTVGGVVFAESRTDPAVGYALAVDAVSATVMPAVGRSGAVPTGPCTD